MESIPAGLAILGSQGCFGTWCLVLNPIFQNILTPTVDKGIFGHQKDQCLVNNTILSTKKVPQILCFCSSYVLRTKMSCLQYNYKNFALHSICLNKYLFFASKYVWTKILLRILTVWLTSLFRSKILEKSLPSLAKCFNKKSRFASEIVKFCSHTVKLYSRPSRKFNFEAVDFVQVRVLYTHIVALAMTGSTVR